MSIEHYSVYRLSDGAFTGQQIGLPAVATDAEKRHALSSVPAGCAAILGRFDHLSQRVEPATGTVIDYQAPQPSQDHEWNPDCRRWQLRPDVAEREQRRTTALAQIAALEASQSRPLRELALDPGNAVARQRLGEIDAEIEGLRAEVVR